MTFLHDRWEMDIVPTLSDYIRIPNRSPAFDPAWRDTGHMARATDLIEQWCRERQLPGMVIERHESEGRTPVLLIEVPATNGGSDTDTVLLYGHLDKQPEMAGWREGLDAWEPVREGDRLYGRGAGDDGYAVFAALTAIEAVHEAGGAHARCVALIEASEESGSPDLPHYMDLLADRIGQPSLVIGLDSGCADYDRLWVTDALRGLVGGNLRVDILTEGVHSGLASGIAPSSFRILRVLLDRIEDSRTGEIKLPEMWVDIPADVRKAAEAFTAEVGEGEARGLPFVEGAHAVSDDPVELVLNSTWRPQLSVIGMDGVPPAANSGNVLRPFTSVRLSFRIPPTADPDAASTALAEALGADPPYGARVTWHQHESARGWAAPPTEPWLAAGLDAASVEAFGAPSATMGTGGTIPFMAMLGHRYPDAQFVITGVLGPGSNAHGPNEYLHLPTAEKVTQAVARLLQAHAAR